MKRIVMSVLVILLCTSTSHTQQTASTVEAPRSVDRSFKYEVDAPAYAYGKGPLVLIDEGHNNFHTASGTYWPFAELLRRDGYVIGSARRAVDRDLLDFCTVYVIADAQPPPEKGDLPTFAPVEIDILQQWVTEGGALFLITDHMPDPGAIALLARSFGVEVNNGYVLNGTLTGRERPIVFSMGGPDKLMDHPLSRGRSPGERIAQVATFAGSAFKAAKDFQPIMILGRGRRAWMPKEYWEFPPGTPNISVEGWYQGGVQECGKGRLACFAEAAMFTAQVFDRGRVKAGMNHPEAKGNARLLLNVMHWLSRLQ